MKCIFYFKGQNWFLLLMLIMLGTAASAQSVTISTGNSCVATANEIQFDVYVTNNSAVSIQFNATAIRLTHSAAILESTGTNTLVFSYVGSSDFPLIWPPNSSPTFTYNTGTRLMGVSSSTGVYLNGGTCAAPNIAPNETKVLGRFSLKNNGQNFVPGADVGLAWHTTTAITGYVNCAVGTTGFNQANGNRTLTAPCTLSIPPSCSSPVVNTSPTDIVICASGTGSYTGSFTGGTPVPALLWQVQTGGVGIFTDLIEATPYSNTSTNTLTITSPGIALNGNRYRLKASNTCGDVFTNAALFTVNADANAGIVSGDATLCAGALSTFTNNGEANGTWSSTNTAVATVNTSGIVTAISAGSSDITYTVNRCTTPASSFATLTVTGNATLAGTAGGAIVCSNATVQPAASQPSGTSFSDGSCKVIATILPSGLVPVTGVVNTCVTVDDQVYTYHNIPYAQRHYDIMPVVNGANATATITLYFTQSEFDAFNAARGIYPAMPTGSADATGIANLLITQFHGTGTYPGNYNGGTVDLINPDDSKIIFNNSLSRWEITFDVNGFSGFYLYTSLTNTPLPVELTNFAGRNSGIINILDWTTSSEQNSSYFELQRSIDGVNFVEAGRVASAGNSSAAKKYTYSDNVASIDSRLFYYRLKLVDINGQFKYSAIVKLALGSKGFKVEATPNPFISQLRIQIDALQNENATITMNSLDGRKVVVKNTSLTKGSNVIVLDKLESLASGIYLLTIKTDSQKAAVKIIKQH